MARPEGKGQDQLEFEKGYRRLKMEMRRDGLFDSSLLYYLYKMSTTLMICLFSAWLVAAHPDAPRTTSRRGAGAGS